MRYVRYLHGEINMAPPISTEEVISVAQVANDELKTGKRDWGYALDGLELKYPRIEYGDLEIWCDATIWGDLVEHPRTAGEFCDLRPAIDDSDDLDELVAALGEIVADFATAPDGSRREFAGCFECELSESFGDASRLHVVDGEVVEIEPEIHWPDPVAVKRARAEGQ